MKLKFMTFFKIKNRHQIVLILFWILMTVSFQNCGQRYTSFKYGNISQSSIADPVGEKLYANNCAICHSSLGTSTIVNKTLDGINNAILTQAQMKFINLSQEDLSRIVSALNFSDIISPSDSVKFKTVVKNRYLLSSDLIDFFVNEDLPTADDTAIKTIINSLITNHPEAFGGNCQRNDEGCTPTICGLASDVNDCRGKLNISAKGEPVPQVNAISKGYINRACEEILFYDRAVENVLQKSGLTFTSSISEDNVSTLSLFIYSGKALPSTAINQSIAIANNAKALGLGLTDQWRFIILPYCVSSLIHLL